MGEKEGDLPTSTDPDPTCPHTPVHGREGGVVNGKERHTLSLTHTQTTVDRTIWIVKVHRWGIIQPGGFCFSLAHRASHLLCFYPALLCSALLGPAPDLFSRLPLSRHSPPVPPSPLPLVLPPASNRGPTLKRREDSSADSGRHLLSDPWSDLNL